MSTLWEPSQSKPEPKKIHKNCGGRVRACETHFILDRDDNQEACCEFLACDKCGKEFLGHNSKEMTEILPL